MSLPRQTDNYTHKQLSSVWFESGPAMDLAKVGVGTELYCIPQGLRRFEALGM